MSTVEEINVKRLKIFDDVIAERKRQDEIHPRFENLTNAERCPILGEEYGEVCQEVNHLKEKPDLTPDEFNRRLREELIHTAAVAFRWLEHLPD